MTTYLRFAFLLLPVTVFGQIAETHQRHGIWLGFSASPDLTYRSVTVRNGDPYKHLHSPTYGYTAGVNLLYEFDDRITLESGVQYAKKGFGSGFNEGFGSHVAPADRFELRLEYSFIYLDVPLKLNYRVFEKSGFFISGGAILHLNLTRSGKSIYTYPDGTIQEEMWDGKPIANEFVPVSVGWVTGFGGEWNIGKGFQLRVEPLFRHMATSVLRGKIYRQYFWSAGLNVGCYLRLR